MNKFTNLSILFGKPTRLVVLQLVLLHGVQPLMGSEYDLEYQVKQVNVDYVQALVQENCMTEYDQHRLLKVAEEVINTKKNEFIQELKVAISAARSQRRINTVKNILLIVFIIIIAALTRTHISYYMTDYGQELERIANRRKIEEREKEFNDALQIHQIIRTAKTT